MHFSSVLRWWEQWQLRLLVLGSLTLQLLLLVAGRVRSGRPSFLFRSCVWMAYLGADALAVYALATLFNRHKVPDADDDTSGILEVLWAPVLLIHLGGQHPMTAYSIEDNELWRRHIVTLVSQVTVTLYVFVKWWPRGDEKLLQAATLLFVIGVLRFSMKPLALKRASIASLMASWAVYPPRQAEGTTLDKIFGWFFADFVTLSSLRNKPEEDDLSLKDYVEQAKELLLRTEDDSEWQDVPNIATSISKLFVDQSAPYRQRLGILQDFLDVIHRCAGSAFENLLVLDITWAFQLFYTNFKGTTSIHGRLQKLLLTFLTLPPIVLFAKSNKHGYQEVDVKVTYILLCGTSLLEFLLLLVPVRRLWSNKVPQHNVISLYAHKSSSKLMKLAYHMGLDCEAYVSKHRYTEEEPESTLIDITDLVIDHVKDGWNLYIHDGASYKRFNSLKGQWTMSRHNISRRQQQRWLNLRLPFDQSVVVWHLATELCLHHPQGVAGDKQPCRRSRTISNYMIYLLFVRPEMLAPGTREGLFMTACNDIKHLIKNAGNSSHSSPPDHGSIARLILRMAKFPWTYSENMVPLVVRACQLAEDIMEVLHDENQRWEVIQGVWVEMLCFSASRCRGYLHAKSMGDGIELLTYVWLILSDMGLETFADKLQWPEFVDEEEDEDDDEVIKPAACSQPRDVPVSEEEIVIFNITSEENNK